MRVCRWHSFVLASSLALAPASVFAKPNKKEIAAAQKADREGQRLEKKKSYEEARDAYQKALEIHDSAETRIRLAGVEDELGHLIEAVGHYRTALEAKKLSFHSRTKAKQSLKRLEKRIPSLTLEIPKGFSGNVWVDDEEVSKGSLSEPLEVNPGSHKVRAEADGYKEFSEEITLQEKDKKNLTILLTELPASEPAPVKDEEAPKEKKDSGGSNALAYVSIGIGVVGVGVGTYMGLQARSTKSDLDGKCQSNVCSQSERDLYDKGKSQANVATVGFVVGAVGIGLGTVLLLTGGKGKAKAEAAQEASLTPVVGPGNVGLRGVF